MSGHRKVGQMPIAKGIRNEYTWTTRTAMPTHLDISWLSSMKDRILASWPVGSTGRSFKGNNQHITVIRNGQRS